jgi:serine/threonine-protein kinase HipA
MVFNIVARNQDDHVKNIGFLMDRAGRWELSPAFDVTYAYRPGSAWTSRHQMSLNGKRDDFTLDDFRRGERVAALKRGRSIQIVDEVRSVVTEWPRYANDARVDDDHASRIASTLRLRFPSA